MNERIDIVCIGMDERGRLLRAVWERRGNHRTSDAAADLAAANGVLFGGSDVRELSAAGIDWRGKVVIDCRDPAGAAGIRGASSGAEELARALPDARVVRAFCGLGTGAIAFVTARDVPNVGSVYTSAFYCGDDSTAKRYVAGLIAECNFEPIDCGGLANAVLLDAIGVLAAELHETVLGPYALTIAHPGEQRSPLDRWM